MTAPTPTPPPDPYATGGRLHWIARARRRKGRPRNTPRPAPADLITFPVPLRTWGAVVVPRDIGEGDMEMLDAVVAAVRAYAKRNTAIAKGAPRA